MITTIQGIVTQAGTFVLAVVLMVGSIYLEAVHGTVPMWLVGFDGIAVAFVFQGGQAFVTARTGLPVANALADMTGKYHELAKAGILSTSPTQSGTSDTTGETTK